jgi:hypothetical protein
MEKKKAYLVGYTPKKTNIDKLSKYIEQKGSKSGYTKKRDNKNKRFG